MSPRDPDLSELIGPFVLGACTTAESAEVRARMVVDATFRREVESFSGVRDALLEAPTPGVDPDRAMKARIMDVVRDEAGLFVAATPAVVVTATDEHRTTRAVPAPTPAASERGGGASGPSWSSVVARWLQRPRRLAILTTVAVVLIVAGVVVGGGTQDDPSGGDTSALRVTAQVLGPAAATGRAEVLVDDGAGELRVSGFPSAGRGRKYQVWVASGQGDPRPTTVLFDVDRDGNGSAKISAATMRGVDVLMLTAEPDGGSPAPTSDPVLQVEMPV